MVLEEDRRKIANPRTTTPKPPIKPTQLATMVSALQLTDIWKFHHPADREFTLHSQIHDSLSRIDYFFSTPSLLPDILTPTIEDLAIFDHTQSP